ncbi:MAG: hypothetical protein H8E85_03795 [Candidatus Marinimicrobia bacterium]|nr:hypothetical protein [Candidatus Neomarinimicrobiota bacterium]
MPNGGPDCCGNCSHNKSVQKMAHPQPERTEEFWELSHCTLRDVNISNPFWTYCSNFNYGKNPEKRNLSEKIIGFITASGLYEGYVRIPWNDKLEPKISTSTICSICKRMVDYGIDVNHKGDVIGFCTNKHYLKWWVTIHGKNDYNPDNYQSPEEKYPNIFEVNILDEINDKMTRGIAKKSFINLSKKTLSINEFINSLINDLDKLGKFTSETKIVIEKLKERAIYESNRRQNN